jgi:hypothetical protein
MSQHPTDSEMEFVRKDTMEFIRNDTLRLHPRLRLHSLEKRRALTAIWLPGEDLGFMIYVLGTRHVAVMEVLKI